MNPYRLRRCLAAAALALPAACTHKVKVEPIKVEPIDITLHIYLEADRKLDEFFGDQPPTQPPATPPPAPAPTGAQGGPS